MRWWAVAKQRCLWKKEETGPLLLANFGMHKLNVGIFIFDGVDILDLAGPFEVFSRTRLVPGAESRRSDETAPFQLLTIAQTTAAVTSGGGLRIWPQHSFSQTPPIDVLVIPGGLGTRKLLQEDAVIEWIRETAVLVKILASVCTDSLLLARAGLLRNRRATTHWGAMAGAEGDRTNCNNRAGGVGSK